MAKIEVEMELQGFKLRIKADRNDLPQISGEIGKQLAGMLQPPAAMLDEPVSRQVDSTVVPPENGNNGNRRGKASRRAKTTNGTPTTPKVEWQHDPTKWGMPKQAWKAGGKVLWLLYVVKNETSHSELSAPTIADTFSAKFKQFVALKKTSMPSILGSLKTNEPALMMDDTTKTPNTWYLSEEGIKAAERFVQEAKAIPPAAANP